MKPTIGRIVIFRQPASEEPVNGTRTHPAVVTRVWGPGEHPLVNLVVFYDNGSPSPSASVGHASKESEQGKAWDWPARES